MGHCEIKAGLNSFYNVISICYSMKACAEPTVPNMECATMRAFTNEDGSIANWLKMNTLSFRLLSEQLSC
jgi:hypothetical protein